jgi:hypothetical protein
MKTVNIQILEVKMWEEVQRVVHLREINLEHSQKVEDSKGCLLKTI